MKREKKEVTFFSLVLPLRRKKKNGFFLGKKSVYGYNLGKVFCGVFQL